MPYLTLPRVLALCLCVDLFSSDWGGLDARQPCGECVTSEQVTYTPETLVSFSVELLDGASEGDADSALREGNPDVVTWLGSPTKGQFPSRTEVVGMDVVDYYIWRRDGMTVGVHFINSPSTMGCENVTLDPVNPASRGRPSNDSIYNDPVPTQPFLPSLDADGCHSCSGFNPELDRRGRIAIPISLGRTRAGVPVGHIWYSGTLGHPLLTARHWTSNPTVAVSGNLFIRNYRPQDLNVVVNGAVHQLSAPQVDAQIHHQKDSTGKPTKVTVVVTPKQGVKAPVATHVFESFTVVKDGGTFEGLAYSQTIAGKPTKTWRFLFDTNTDLLDWEVQEPDGRSRRLVEIQFPFSGDPKMDPQMRNAQYRESYPANSEQRDIEISTLYRNEKIPNPGTDGVFPVGSRPLQRIHREASHRIGHPQNQWIEVDRVVYGYVTDLIQSVPAGQSYKAFAFGKPAWEYHRDGSWKVFTFYL